MWKGVPTIYDSVLLHYSVETIGQELTLIDRGLLIQVNFDQLSSVLEQPPFRVGSVTMYVVQ